MNTQLSIFDAAPGQLAVPSYLQAFGSNLGTDLSIGAGRNRLGLKGNRFRLIVNGIEEGIVESTSLDVVIVGASPGVGRIFFDGVYNEDEKMHPACYSADGIAPGADVTNPQSVKCATCPQNEKGSKITQDGTKTRACNFFKRLAVAIVADDLKRVFQLDAKALTIFGQGESARNLFTLSEYSNKFKTRGLDPAHYVTRLTFDVNSSVPKLYFSPLRFVEENEAVKIQELVNSDDTKFICTITAITDASDAVSEEPAVPQAATPTAAPAPVAPAPAPKAPVQTIVKTAPAGQPAAPMVTKIVTAGKPAAKPVAPPVATAAPTAQIIKKPAPTPVVREVSAVADDPNITAFLAQLEEAEGA